MFLPFRVRAHARLREHLDRRLVVRPESNVSCTQQQHGKEMNV